MIFSIGSFGYVFSIEENIIIDKKLVYLNKNIVINGNITILKGGNLTIINSTLYFNNEKRKGYVLEALPSSTLIIKSSTIDGPIDKFYSIFVHNNVTLVIEDSVVKNAGWKDQRESGYYLWVGPAYTNDLSIYGHGLEINTTVVSFKRNTFINIASIRFYSSYNIVENNTIIGFRHEGLAFINSHNNIVRYNKILNSTAINRETHGIRFYPGTRNEEIYNNIIKHVAKGIMISQIPPWSAGYNFTIYDNKISYVINGLEAKLVNSHIFNENYKNILSSGIILAASQSVIVENCTFINFTYYPKEISDPSYYQLVKKYIHPKYPRAYYNFMILIRGGILISWSGRNLTFFNNYISNIPVYGYGVGFDVKYIVYDVKIKNNTIRNIGIIPEWKIMNPGLYSVPLSYIKYPPPPGGAITIESTENLVIENNRFENCINGIITSFPDALGNYGNLTIKDNVSEGQKNSSWYEYNKLKVWKTIGIGISTNAYRPDENSERFKVYNSFAKVVISNNIVRNYSYPIVLDIPNNTLKKVYVFNNSFISFEKIILSKNLNISNTNVLIPKIIKKLSFRYLRTNSIVMKH